jgi:hypothetical protein
MGNKRRGMDRIFTDVTITLDVTDMNPKHYTRVIKELEKLSNGPLNFESYNGDTLGALSDDQVKKLRQVRKHYESTLATRTRAQFGMEHSSASKSSHGGAT